MFKARLTYYNENSPTTDGGMNRSFFCKKYLQNTTLFLKIYPIRRGPRLIIQSDGGECGPTYPLFSGY